MFNTKDPIALHLSAFGPRTRALTAKLKAGWIDFVGKVENGIKEVEAMREAWTKAGHAIGDLQATAFALGCVLKDGEPANSERAMAQAGPRAAVMLHRAADEALAGLKPGVAMLSTPEIQAYIELARGFEPKDAPYLENHRGHLMFVKAEEKRFVSAELIAQHLVHGKRGRDQEAHRGAARRGLQPVHHPARARPGTWRSPTGPASARRLLESAAWPAHGLPDRGFQPLMIMSARDARGPEEHELTAGGPRSLTD